MINKPEGIESFGVVRQLKFRYLFHKIGFAGTLDPLASGLLLVGINKATKNIDIIYHCIAIVPVTKNKKEFERRPIRSLRRGVLLSAQDLNFQNFVFLIERTAKCFKMI